ncbi:MAG: hypothetical protein DRG34_00675 [Deltaproteobacteria bacterium]|nr:MAG: hypothetical protein DRG34_00675 [Deltaproteobacteria bacterium]
MRRSSLQRLPSWRASVDCCPWSVVETV